LATDRDSLDKIFQYATTTKKSGFSSKRISVISFFVFGSNTFIQFVSPNFLIGDGVKIWFLHTFLSSCVIIAETKNLLSSIRDFNADIEKSGVPANTTL
jgi:hypothetical protein